MSLKIEVWGDFACFTRPEMKAERVSYDIMTPLLPGAFLRQSIGIPVFAITSIRFIC